MSSTSPTRLSGISFSKFASASGVSQADLLIGVLIAPGAILTIDANFLGCKFLSNTLHHHIYTGDLDCKIDKISIRKAKIFIILRNL